MKWWQTKKASEELLGNKKTLTTTTIDQMLLTNEQNPHYPTTNTQTEEDGGRKKKMRRRMSSKKKLVNEKDFDFIKTLSQNGLYNKQIVDVTGFGYSTISRIINTSSWEDWQEYKEQLRIKNQQYRKPQIDTKHDEQPKEEKEPTQKSVLISFDAGDKAAEASLEVVISIAEKLGLQVER